jgi:hypothetical protein
VHLITFLFRVLKEQSSGTVVLLVAAVVEGGVAEAGGAQVNDVVTAVNGDSDALLTNNTPELFQAYESALPRPLVITFSRKGGGAAGAELLLEASEAHAQHTRGATTAEYSIKKQLTLAASSAALFAVVAAVLVAKRRRVASAPALEETPQALSTLSTDDCEAL